MALIVNNTDDSSAGSLRYMLAQSNSAAGLQIITFLPSLAGQTITLTTGEYEITDPVTIDGDLNNDGLPDITISAQESRHFTIRSGSSGGSPEDILNTIDGLTLTGGWSGTGGGSILLTNSSHLYLKNSVLLNNLCSESQGAAIRTIDNSESVLVIQDCTIQDNRASGTGARGGGLSSDEGTTVVVSGSTFYLNSGEEAGGAIYAEGLIYITDSTIVENSATIGGGIYVTKNATIVHSTFSDNSPTVFYADVGEIELGHTISGCTDGNPFGATAGGFYTSLGWNLICNNGGAGTAFVNTVNNDQVGTPVDNLDPRLGFFGDNGGPTWTYSINETSLAYNAGNPSAVEGEGDVPETDQRGEPRILATRIDIGAFEFVPPTVTPSITSSNTASMSLGASLSNTPSVTPSAGSAVSNSPLPPTGGTATGTGTTTGTPGRKSTTGGRGRGTTGNRRRGTTSEPKSDDDSSATPARAVETFFLWNAIHRLSSWVGEWVPSKTALSSEQHESLRQLEAELEAYEKKQPEVLLLPSKNVQECIHLEYLLEDAKEAIEQARRASTQEFQSLLEDAQEQLVVLGDALAELLEEYEDLNALPEINVVAKQADCMHDFDLDSPCHAPQTRMLQSPFQGGRLLPSA